MTRRTLVLGHELGPWQDWLLAAAVWGWVGLQVASLWMAG